MLSWVVIITEQQCTTKAVCADLTVFETSQPILVIYIPVVATLPHSTSLLVERWFHIGVSGHQTMPRLSPEVVSGTVQ